MAMVNLTFRVSGEELIIMKAATLRLAKKRPWRKDYTVSDFIRDCVSERLQHLSRAEDSRKRRKGLVADSIVEPKPLPKQTLILADEGTGFPIDREGVE